MFQTTNKYYTFVHLFGLDSELMTPTIRSNMDLIHNLDCPLRRFIWSLPDDLPSSQDIAASSQRGTH